MIREYRITKDYGPAHITAVLRNGTLLSILPEVDHELYDIALAKAWKDPDDENSAAIKHPYAMPDEAYEFEEGWGIDDFSMMIDPGKLHALMCLLDDYPVDQLVLYEGAADDEEDE